MYQIISEKCKKENNITTFDDLELIKQDDGYWHYIDEHEKIRSTEQA